MTVQSSRTPVILGLYIERAQNCRQEKLAISKMDGAFSEEQTNIVAIAHGRATPRVRCPLVISTCRERKVYKLSVTPSPFQSQTTIVSRLRPINHTYNSRFLEYPAMIEPATLATMWSHTTASKATVATRFLEMRTHGRETALSDLLRNAGVSSGYRPRLADVDAATLDPTRSKWVIRVMQNHFR